MIILAVIAVVLFVSFGLIVLRGAPYVPTHRGQLPLAFDELLAIGKEDTIVDLGSGDGVVLAAAAERGAQAVGYELNYILCLVTYWRFRKNPRVKIKFTDYERIAALPAGTTVVYAFTTGVGINRIFVKLQQWSQLQDFYFISYGFEIPNQRPLRSSGGMHLYEFNGQKLYRSPK
jgi:hypothetical protein